jgi:hypothetical protein
MNKIIMRMAEGKYNGTLKFCVREMVNYMEMEDRNINK